MKRWNRSRIFDTGNVMFFLLVGFVTLYPFWNIAVLSFNDPLDSIRGGVYFWPRKFSLLSYQAVFQGNQDLLQSFITSVSRTIIGTMASVFSITLMAFILSRRDFVARKLFTRVFLLTMYLNAGLIPTYILYRDLNLLNRFPVYILPTLISGFYLLIMKSFMQDIPDSIQEAAIIDGTTDFQLFYRIVVPMCIPVIATIGLYVAVWQWGSWQDTYFFAPRNARITTLQYEMVKIVRNNAQMTSQQVQDMASRGVITTPQSIQNAIIVIATVPILFVYPFLQRYFVQGLTLGAVKE